MAGRTIIIEESHEERIERRRMPKKAVEGLLRISRREN